jgi:rubrerythrin
MSLIEKIDALEEHLVNNNSYFDGAEWLFGKVREAILSEQKETCEWTQSNEDNNVWECSKCDAVWIFMEGSPKDNEMDYCPRCGRIINQPSTDN